MQDADGITVASYNVHKAVGGDRQRNPKRIAAVIAEINADIVALQEVDLRYGTRAGLLDLGAVEQEIGLAPLRSDVVGLSHGFHGNLLLVRSPEAQEVHRIALPGLEARGALVTDLLINRKPLRVISAHLGLLPSSRRSQVRAILDKIAALEHRPTILMGDLNEWRTGTGSSLRGLAPHFPNAPIVRSFPSRYPMLPLDRIMATKGLDLTEVAVHDTPLARAASDHLPIKARLLFS